MGIVRRAVVKTLWIGSEMRLSLVLSAFLFCYSSCSFDIFILSLTLQLFLSTNFFSPTILWILLYSAQ
ncbi:hypothetical protein POJ06DRAFT_259810 [Lipomyces tetrasporus]|uniref:Uncharacterized protein n=1 Tax=Lipomyces tetrasporus TaxID=54092 RepID=A0AAD7QLW3_9ASCO|nr:uncharacterized protein POJ06DRAFT_259810 [Lipomyces tetrasporus]KAJ8097711.1 hypothetical protein POJ06DRAFT_259810 [Lipomyces tetrasporus]